MNSALSVSSESCPAGDGDGDGCCQNSVSPLLLITGAAAHQLPGPPQRLN